MPLTLRRRKPEGSWYVRGSVRIGKDVERIAEHTTGSRDRATAEVYVQKLQAEISHKLLYRRGGDPAKGGRVWAALSGNTVVYFFGAGDLIKIGVTADVEKRRQFIQNAHGAPVEVLAVIRGGRDMEQLLHAIFRPYRARGEWFRLPDTLRASIVALGKWTGRRKPWQILGEEFAALREAS